MSGTGRNGTTLAETLNPPSDMHKNKKSKSMPKAIKKIGKAVSKKAKKAGKKY